MKTTFTILMVLFFVQIGFSQSMVVNKNDGGKATFPLSDIKNITFEISQIPTNGLVAYYPFNGNANDESGNNNNGTVYGGALLTNDRKGNANRAFSFDGVNDYIHINNSSSLQSPNKEITISAWVKPNSISSYGAYIICKNSLNNLDPFQYRLEINTGSQILFGFKDSNTTYVDFYQSSTIKNNEWSFLTVTYNSSSLKFYLDGNLLGSQSFSGSIFSDDKGLDIGRDAHGDSEWHSGLIDDIRIYNRALTEQEIQALYKE